MAVSKVVLGDETLIDLTSDTVSEDTLLEGTTAHGANGEEVIGGVVVTPMYTGTKAAIEEAIALGKIPEDAVVNITDDEETSSFQTQIDEINSSLKFLPDYENAINPFSSNITSDTTYTAPYNGIFLVRWWVNGGSNSCYASINGNKVAETPNTGGSIDPIIVSKGDVINFTISNANISNASMFVPFK